MKMLGLSIIGLMCPHDISEHKFKVYLELLYAMRV